MYQQLKRAELKLSLSCKIHNNYYFQNMSHFLAEIAEIFSIAWNSRANVGRSLAKRFF